MSYTATYIVSKAGDLLYSEEYPNSHGFCTYVWTMLCNKYGIGSWYIDENADKLWKLANDPRLLSCEAITLETTFDHAIIRKEDFAEVIRAYRDFERLHLPGKHVSHLSSISLEMEKYLDDENVIGFCFYQTSLIQNPWVKYGEEEREYNIYKDTKHHFVPIKGAA